MRSLNDPELIFHRLLRDDHEALLLYWKNVAYFSCLHLHIMLLKSTMDRDIDIHSNLYLQHIKLTIYGGQYLDFIISNFLCICAFACPYVYSART